MQASDGVFSPQAPKNNIEEVPKKLPKTLTKEIQSIQHRIQTLCTDEFNKIGTTSDEIPSSEIKDLKACIDSLGTQDKNLNVILNKQIVLINNLFINKNISDKEKLFNELNNSTIEIGTLLAPAPVNTSIDQINNPNHTKESIESEISSTVEGLERYADSLDSNGMADTEEVRTKLLEQAPGNNLPGKCAVALKNMMDQNWQNSSDIQQLLQLQKVEKLANFYAKELPPSSKEAKDMSELLTTLKSQFKFDQSLESLMKSTIIHFGALLAQNLAPTEKANILKTKSTFEMMTLLYKKRNEISSESDQSTRDNKAQELSHAGIEKGFITGKTGLEAKKSMEYRANLLLITYQKAKGLGKEEEFFSKVGVGDPCANARMGRVEEYLGELSGQGGFQEDLSTDRIFSVCDVALMNLIDMMVEEGKLDENEINQIKPEDVDAIEFAKQLAMYGGKSENATPFRDYLVRKHFCENKNNIDWNNVSKKLIQSDDFKTLLIRGVNLALLNY